jgi:uncharacterized membrane protein YdjX (TVP38/TMEM64 family)
MESLKRRPQEKRLAIEGFLGQAMNNPIKITLFAIWFTILSAAIYSYLMLEISLNELAGKLQEFVESYGVWGPILYIVVYSFRSLILFPASLLTAISGLLFGPWHGILFTIIGENISGNISFVVGRYFGSGLMKHLGSKIKVIRSLECKFRKSGFLTVLTMRLMYMPFDLVGYMSGVCNIRQREFALGTFIGTIPGLATFVLLGSAITETKNLPLAFSFLALGWALSRCLKEKEQLGNAISAL